MYVHIRIILEELSNGTGNMF